MLKKAIIGLSCSYEYGDIFKETMEVGLKLPMWNFTSESYVRCIEEAGGIPVLIPNLLDKGALHQILDSLDGFLLTGGNDVDPLTYGEVDKGKCGRIVPQRDAQDIEIAKYIIKKTDKPLFAICRGLQILNVALGGSLMQDVESEGYMRHSKANYALDAVTHHVRLKEGTRVHSIFSSDSLGVNSFHHQAIRNLAPSLKAGAWSDDGLIEEAEMEGDRFVLGVQWHPEKMLFSAEQKKLFSAFVKECR